jgi:hypothetical protein
MVYCPHCSERLPKPATVCPYCKRTVDFRLISSLYEPTESSKVNKKIKRKIWFREKLLIILPIITLVIGFIGGVISMYIFSQAQFSSSRTEYEDQISTLQRTISEGEKKVANSQGELNNVIAEKDLIISSLSEQNQIYSRMVAFTNRLAKASTITPTSPQDIDFFQRNIRYLQSLFNQEQEKLKETSYTSPEAFNLIPIPQFLE